MSRLVCQHPKLAFRWLPGLVRHSVRELLLALAPYPPGTLVASVLKMLEGDADARETYRRERLQTYIGTVEREREKAIERQCR